jgi:CRP-like cAMP-binding protein
MGLNVPPELKEGRSARGLDCRLLVERAADMGILLSPASYHAGALIFSQGDRAEKLYIICEGWVKLVYVMPDGRAFLLRLLGPGDLLGKSALTGRVYRASAQALGSTRLIALKPQELSRLLAGFDDLALNLIAALTEEAYELHARMLAAVRGSVEEELAVLLHEDDLKSVNQLTDTFTELEYYVN